MIVWVDERDPNAGRPPASQVGRGVLTPPLSTEVGRDVLIPPLSTQVGRDVLIAPQTSCTEVGRGLKQGGRGVPTPPSANSDGSCGLRRDGDIAPYLRAYGAGCFGSARSALSRYTFLRIGSGNPMP
jgi:hypothetical protein